MHEQHDLSEAFLQRVGVGLGCRIGSGLTPANGAAQALVAPMPFAFRLQSREAQTHEKTFPRPCCKGLGVGIRESGVGLTLRMTSFPVRRQLLYPDVFWRPGCREGRNAQEARPFRGLPARVGFRVYRV